MALDKGRGGSGYKYKARDAEAVKKRAEQEGGNFDSIFKSGIDTFRAKQGTNTVRFIPPTWEDPEHYAFDVWVHSYIGADNGTYLCPKKMKGHACPICDAQVEAAEAGEEEEAKKLRATKKAVAWIIDRDDKKPIPKVWTMSWSQDKEIATLCHSEKTGKAILLDDPEKGFDLSFKRTGQQLNTRYMGYVVDREDSSLADTQKEINAIMALVEDQPIPDILAYKDAAYLQSVVDGKSSKKEKDPDEEDEPSSRRRPSRDRGDEPEEEERPSRRRREPEPEADEDPPRRRRAEPEEDEPAPRRRAAREEPEEDEPAPRRRAARDEPEPEEEERPSRRRARDPEPEEDEPAPRRRRAEPEEEEPAPRRRAAREEPEDDPEPPRRRRAAAEPEAEPEEEERPRRRRAEPEEDPEPAPRRRRAEPEPEEEAEPEERPRRRRA